MSTPVTAVEASRARISSSPAATATIAPPVGRTCIRRPRAATIVAASFSDSMPAAYAALISPIEWPITTSGRIPHDSTSRNRAVSTAKRAAWVYTV
ncbi:hypothetical protein STANM309S_00621 [Streptomyces tanashiensis]